jgi:hypothetical protein
MLDAAQPLYESERNLVIGSPEEAPSVGRHFDHMLVPSIPRAIELVGRESAYRFFLIGDALFHEDAIQYADRIHLTTVEGTHHTAEFFPDFDDGFETDPTVIPRAGESNGVKFINQSYRRK